jgi:hypothetical protein
MRHNYVNCLSGGNTDEGWNKTDSRQNMTDRGDTEVDVGGGTNG